MEPAPGAGREGVEATMAAELGPTMEWWLAGKMARGRVTERTAASQRVWLMNFASYVGEATPVSAVDSQHFEQWLAQLRTRSGKEMKPGSKNTVAAPVRAFFAWAQRRGFTQADPCVDVERTKVPEGPPRALSGPQVARLAAAAPNHEWRAMILVAVNLGLRIGDLAAMRVEHWDRDTQTLRLVASKGGDEDTLPTNGEAGEVLGGWIDHGLGGRRTGPMWPSSVNPEENYDRNWIGANIRRIAVRVGVDMTAHDLRHTRLTDLTRAGVPVPVAMRLSRHKSMGSFQRYTKANLDEVRSVLEHMEPYRPTSPD